MGKTAYSAGVLKGGLNEIKNGFVEAKLSTLCKIAVVMDVSVKDFFDFDIDMSEFDL